MSSTFDVGVFLDDPSKNHDEKKIFVEKLWLRPLDEHIEAFSAYFELLRDEVKALLNTKRTGLSDLEFNHVLTIRDAILQNYSGSQAELRQIVADQLQGTGIPDEAIPHTIMFVIRVLLMIKVKQSTGSINVRDNTLYLFSNIGALKHVKGAQELTSRFYTEDFIDETLATSHLFFPKPHPGYRYSDYITWFKNKQGKIETWQRSLPSPNNPAVSRLYTAYPVWNQRLAWVLEASKNQPNMGLRRIWYDDRDLSLWWTRWALITAVFLTILFGLIQSITGIIQVVYAANP
ncbi:hypothetical protein FPOAC1_007740 [Fusarium poae]|uniref:hypothetical protein n=1 Tax=Fusarium poae TaxID=36050 RepID=UPI001CE81079|nr:hypothetical protein FPOAC1_007740 [Fusarium poae]KAG8668361.1 hypothetical protein FPOAC1_007740 [Fusarium poae]